ncbi:MAG: flagellar basal body P-ring formation chaperone FlgA [Vicinamibacterales bacterium]|nr:flagellar basal body P-ring formation chaperone FlgA [Vicinamibacterales bacterium]
MPGGRDLAAQSDPGGDVAVRLALIQAVRLRMGEQAAVRLEHVAFTLAGPADTTGLTAAPEPGSRLGRPVRFALLLPPSNGRPRPSRVGSATAHVFVAVEHARAARAVARGTTLDDTDLATSHDELGPVPLVPVPVRADMIGSRAVRDLLAGEVLTTALVRTQPLVKAGETVRTTVKLGGIEAVGQAVAQQSGQRHDRIRLINPESRRPLFGRITGPGNVEVLHVQ